MNRIYRSIWNDALEVWMAVSEISKRQGKHSSKYHKLLAAGLLVCVMPVWALPTGEQLMAGQASVSVPTVNQMQINQTSQNAVINWQGFSVGQQEAVNIQQPNPQSALLNRVVGQDASQIQGRINANGQVYLTNPNGVIFSSTARVDVGGLVATTHDISNQDFMNGNRHFTQHNGTTGTVENHGIINTHAGGVVALIGDSVTNTGTITTPKGTTALAVGKTVDLDLIGDGLVEVKVDGAVLNAQITNKGAIQADGGRVVLTARAAGQLVDTVINQQGIIKAQGMVNRNGEIILDGGTSGIVQVSGTLDADGQIGGKVNVKGDNIQINNGAIVTASGDNGGGTIEIGSKQSTTQNTVQQGATLSTNSKKQGNAGTINVLADTGKGTVKVAGQLNAVALKQGNGGNIDTSAAHVNIADSAKISTQAKLGNSGIWLIDPYDFTIAATGGDITGAALSSALTGNNVTIQTGALSAICTGAVCGTGKSTGNGDIFVNDTVAWAANNLTLSAYRNINIDNNLNGSGTAQLALEYGQGALAAGNTSDYFVRAPVNLPAGNNFSTKLGSDGTVTNYMVITNLGVVNDATTTSLQGIQNNLTGNYALGGNIDASPAQNWASATGTGFEPIGDFTGQFHGLGHSISNLTINSAKFSGGVGLFGNVGSQGLLRDVGLINTSVTSSTFSDVGGLVGSNGGTISNAYATGTISGNGVGGGLVGSNGGTISNAYATGSVSGGFLVGGLVGSNYYTISNSHYNIDKVLINGGHFVTEGGIYNTQYQDWIGHNKALNISDYAATLPLDNATGYYNINSLQGFRDLLGFADNPTYKFRLNTDMNLAAASGLFIPVLAGEFDGAGHILSNLTLNQSFTNQLGMFGEVRSTATVKNLGLTNVQITGGNQVGGLSGDNSGYINTVYATGSVSGTDMVGGLVGINGGPISKAYTAGSVSGKFGVGGLVGVNVSSISNAYATSNVSGNNTIGGLVGRNGDFYGFITNTYATGGVTGDFDVGGLVGCNNNMVSFSNINNSFWNTETTGKNMNSGIGLIAGYGELNNVSGKTTAEMMQLATFSNSGWDIANTGGSTAVWRIYEGSTMPLLRSFLIPLTINADGTYSSTGVDNSHLFGSGTEIYSDQQGYDISNFLVKPPVISTITPSVSLPMLTTSVSLPTLTPLQVSTTFLDQFKQILANFDNNVDADYGQYKGDNYASKPLGYEWHKEHGKKQWSEKIYLEKRNINLKDFYDALLYIIEHGGIKLPEGLIISKSNDATN